MPLRIGITLGDITGIGPEVAFKAIASEEASDETRYVLIGDARCLRQLNDSLRLKLPLADYAGSVEGDRFTILDSGGEPLPANLKLWHNPGAAILQRIVEQIGEHPHEPLTVNPDYRKIRRDSQLRALGLDALTKLFDDGLEQCRQRHVHALGQHAAGARELQDIVDVRLHLPNGLLDFNQRIGCSAVVAA